VQQEQPGVCTSDASASSVTVPHSSHRLARRSASACKAKVALTQPQAGHFTTSRTGGLSLASGSRRSSWIWPMPYDATKPGIASLRPYLAECVPLPAHWGQDAPRPGSRSNCH
jgi:hypothetical protein